MNNQITLQQAIDLTTRFRTRKADLIKPEYAEKDILPTCETFDREAIDKMLAHPECVKLRIYLGMSEDLNIRMILVGVDAADKDILPLSSQLNKDGGEGDDDEEIIVEDGLRCPPFCPPPSHLNP